MSICCTLLEMKRFTLALLLVLPAFGATTNIVDVLSLAGTSSTPPKFNGSLNISWPTFTDSGGGVHPRGQTTYKVSNGVVNLYLEPSDSSTLGSAAFTYQVSYSLTNGLQNIENWSVPTSATAVNLNTVRSNNPVTPGSFIATTQILNGSATNGQCLVSNGAGWVPGSCAGGTIYYQTIQSNAVDQTQRTKLNFTTNFTASDSASPSRTSIDLSASGVTASTYGDSSHVAQFTVDAKGRITSAVAVAISGGGVPCTVTALSLQYNNAGAFGCVTEFTYGSSTITASSSGKLDLSPASVLSGLKLPSAAGAAPTADGFVATNTTNHTLAYGSNGTTLVGAVAATGTGTATTCSNQVVTAVSGVAVPTCTTITSSYVNTSIAVTGTDINTSSQVVATHLTSALPLAQGGLGADFSTIAKGGLIVGTASGTTGIKAVGTDGQILMADSTQTGGVKWAAASGGGTVTSIATTSPIGGGTITSSGTLTCTTCVTSAASLTSNQLVIGQGSQGSATLGSLGTTTTLLHGNAAGAPTFAAVSMTADVSGTLPLVNGGTNSTDSAVNGALVYSNASQHKIGAAGTAKQIPISGGAGAYSWIDFPNVFEAPAANCVATVAGAGWSTGLTAVCVGGSNNLGGTLPFADASTGQFNMQIPGDWDTASQPYFKIVFNSGANTSGTVIFDITTACTKEDGSVTSDPSFTAADSTASKTMAAATRAWSSTVQLTHVTSGNNCLPGGQMIVKVTRATDTASSVVQVDKAVMTFPRLLTVQAN